MSPADHAAREAAARAADALAKAAERYHSALRVLSPDLALRATAAEMVRLLVGLAAADSTHPDEVARALVVALAGACRGLPTETIVSRLRATADWLEGATVRRKEAA